MVAAEQTCVRPAPMTVCRRFPSCARSSTASTGSSASRRSSCQSATWPAPTACPPMSSRLRYTASCAHTGRVCRDDLRELLERFEFVDAARKVVGVGSVGTRAFIALLRGRDEGDPLFLQIKEATASVLEDSLPASTYANHGERVVQGQRRMQACQRHLPRLDDRAGSQSPLLLAATARHEGLAGRRDDIAVRTEDLRTHMCGWTLARAHARSGDPVAIAAYLGDSDRFDTSIAHFAERYADQNDHDYRAFTEADPLRADRGSRRRLRPSTGSAKPHNHRRWEHPAERVTSIFQDIQDHPRSGGGYFSELSRASFSCSSRAGGGMIGQSFQHHQPDRRGGSSEPKPGFRHPGQNAVASGGVARDVVRDLPRLWRSWSLGLILVAGAVS